MRTTQPPRNLKPKKLAPLLASIVYVLGFAAGGVLTRVAFGYGGLKPPLLLLVLLAGVLSMSVLRAQAVFSSQKTACAWLVFASLFGIGPAAEAWLHVLAAWCGFTPAAFTWHGHIISLTISAMLGSVALVWLMRKVAWPNQAVNTIGRPSCATFGMLAWLVALAVALRLVVGVIDAVMELRPGHSFAPLEVANPWLRLQGAGANWGLGAGWASALNTLGFLVLLCLRESLRVLPLWWWLQRVGQFYPQTLPWQKRFLGWFWPLFVLGEFTPFLIGEPTFSASWLILRMVVGLVRAGLLALLGMRLLSMTRSGADSPLD